MRTKILILSLVCCFSLVYSQREQYLYYIEFVSSQNKPKVIQQSTHSKTILLNGQQFEVLNYEEIFANYTSQKLNNTSLFEFKNFDDYNRFTFVFRNEIKNSEKINIDGEDPLLMNPSTKSEVTSNSYEGMNYVDQMLYTPNDYYLFPTNIAHTHLDLINAREAWDYSKGDGIIVGVSDNGFRLTHREFENKIATLPNQTVINSSDNHGNVVAGLAGSKTDNNFGVASIGFNNQLLVTDRYSYGSWGYLKQLSLNGARVINMSWLSSCSFLQTEQDAVNELYQNGTVLVAAAGNVSCGSSYAKVYPASYKNVIAVSGVGHLNELNSPITINVKDVHYANYATQQNNTQNNEDVDIVAPSYDMDGLPYSGCDECLGRVWTGTSLAAPIVSGAVSLLLSSNNCLTPAEVETIIKLTAANIDHIPPNQVFAGLLGAGRLDAGKANKIAWQTNASNGGEIIIENKKFNRWDFQLLNSPEYIKIRNEEFTGNSNIMFRAKKGITLGVNTLLTPNSGKSHYFFVENLNTCSRTNNTENPQSFGRKYDEKSSNSRYQSVRILPNPASDYVRILTKHNVEKIEVFDMIGRQVKVNYSNEKIDIQNLPIGNYLLKIHTNFDVSEFKLIKK